MSSINRQQPRLNRSKSNRTVDDLKTRRGAINNNSFHAKQREENQHETPSDAATQTLPTANRQLQTEV